MTMIVDIDIGNTSANWRLSSDAEIIARGVTSSRKNDWSDFLPLRHYKPRRVRVSNVAGALVAEQLQSVVTDYFQLDVEFAAPCASVGQVTSGYKQPEQLGVDRWLAILAAWDLFAERLVVIDAGSAMTFDFVDSHGCHKGGYIVPGQSMMIDALLGGTSGVRVSAQSVSSTDSGADTSRAVQNGCFSLALALIEKVVQKDTAGRADLNVVLTGGDAVALLKYLPSSVAHKPDLVLDGLAVALP